MHMKQFYMYNVLIVPFPWNSLTTNFALSFIFPLKRIFFRVFYLKWS